MTPRANKIKVTTSSDGTDIGHGGNTAHGADHDRGGPDIPADDLGHDQGGRQTTRTQPLAESQAHLRDTPDQDQVGGRPRGVLGGGGRDDGRQQPPGHHSKHPRDDEGHQLSSEGRWRPPRSR